MAKRTELQTKLSLLQKLFDTGCVTEKQLQSLEIEEILQIPGITVDEMKELVLLQKSAKKNRLFSYLAGSAILAKEEDDNNAQSYL